jgi:hypothetical protein
MPGPKQPPSAAGAAAKKSTSVWSMSTPHAPLGAVAKVTFGFQPLVQIAPWFTRFESASALSRRSL